MTAKAEDAGLKHSARRKNLKQLQIPGVPEESSWWRLTAWLADRPFTRQQVSERLLAFHSLV